VSLEQDHYITPLLVIQFKLKETANFNLCPALNIANITDVDSSM
jgi:hypothetical protein